MRVDHEYLDVIGRPQAQMSYRKKDGHHTNISSTTVNSTTADESKLTLQFCINKPCRSLAHGEDWPYCYCCETMPGEPCFLEEEDCRAKCPICDPDCPPQQPQEIKA